MHEIESKSPCCNAPMSLCRCPEAEKHCMKCGRIVTPNPEPPENDGEKGKSQTRGKTVSGKSWETTVQHVVTDLEEDRKFLDRWKKDETTGELHDLIDRLLAAKERVVGAACAEKLMTNYGDGQDAIVIISNDDNKPTQRPGLQELMSLFNPPQK